MKAKIYTQTLLALFIHAVVIGQTPSSRQILPVLGAGKNSSTGQKDGSKVSDSQKNSAAEFVQNLKKKLPTVISSDMPENASNGIDNSSFNYFSSQCPVSMALANELLKQADDLALNEKILRNEAKTKTGEEKKALTRSADEAMIQSEIKQIQASEISGRISFEKYKENNSEFSDLINKNNIDNNVLTYAKDVNARASHDMKMAREMREEAYAMPTIGAKLGTMSNAEEQEFLALRKQESAIGIIKKSTASLSNYISEDLAVK